RDGATQRVGISLRSRVRHHPPRSVEREEQTAGDRQMDRAGLAKRIKAVAYLTGQFTLRSGATSTFYWDKYRFESDPTILVDVAEGLAGLLPASYDRLAGLELGGIPLATALSMRTGTPCLYVRKAAKPYGTSNLVEGGYPAGTRAVVVEDVITSGGQV